jgi:1,4-dihydroxy-2-naphthoyl-CoA hydrolase
VLYGPAMTDTATGAFADMKLDSGWAGAMGLEMIRVSPEEVVIEWTVDARHLQPFGLVHGGVHAGVVETACSIGGGVHAAANGQAVVGVENHTSFLRGVRGGRLRATARPVQLGRRAQLWQTDIVDEQGRLVATGRVRLFTVDPGNPGG